VTGRTSARVVVVVRARAGFFLRGVWGRVAACVDALAAPSLRAGSGHVAQMQRTITTSSAMSACLRSIGRTP
jgi:hypothetical protein